MPGHQQLRFMQPTEHFKAEPIYGQVKQKKTSKGKHPLFEDLKARRMWERAEYERLMKHREIPARKSDCSPYNKFDSLKLIGSCNDINYLDSFMSMPRQKPPSDHDEKGGRMRPRQLSKSSSTVFSKGQQPQHRNSIQSDSSAMTAAVLANLRNTTSDDNIYESVEMIHYKKTLQNLNRIQKTRSVQKTGHPLFDSLRVEQALRGPSARKNSNSRSQEYITSDGNSPSHSSSSSGDEYDTYPRLLVKQSRRPQHKHNGPSLQDLNKVYLQQLHQISEGTMSKKHDKQKAQPRKKSVDAAGSESDEDWIIPRPKILSGRMAMQQRRIDPPTSSSGAEESDSSVNSAVLR